MRGYVHDWGRSSPVPLVGGRGWRSMNDARLRHDLPTPTLAFPTREIGEESITESVVAPRCGVREDFELPWLIRNLNKAHHSGGFRFGFIGSPVRRMPASRFRTAAGSTSTSCCSSCGSPPQ